MERKVILYIAMSLDGYIAQLNDDLSFLSIVEDEIEDYGYYQFTENVDTVIMGRKTYDWIMSKVSIFPHNDKKTFIITRSAKLIESGSNYYNGNLKDLVTNLKKENGKNIFIDGGSEIVNDLLKENLIDEYIISVIPILIGNGIKLFNDGRPDQRLALISAKHYNKGLVQLHYKNY